MKFVLLLLLSLVAYTLCASSYAVTISTKTTYAAQKTAAWKVVNPNGGCAHLATYETAAEFQSLITTALATSSNTAFTLFLGAEKQSDSNTFIWAVGARRGQPFFSAHVISIDDTSSSFYDINFESGFICHQEWCFEPHNFEGYRFVYDASSEAIFLSYSSSTSYFVGPANSTLTADYMAVEIELPGLLPNADGGSKFLVQYGPIPYYDANQAAITGGNYLARIKSQAQLNWILDELQCLVTTSQFWLGFEVDYVTHDIIFSSGPSQGQVLYDSNDGKCVPDLFCPISTPSKRAATAFSYVPHFFQDEFALTLDLGSRSFVELATTSSPTGYIVQAEYCSINAKQFLRFPFAENTNSDSRICTPNPSSNWAASVPDFEANQEGIFNDNSFFAGAAHSFVNDLYSTQVKKTLYFDCNCRTDPKINLSCLGSTDFPGCDLYTDAYNYYNINEYSARLKAGINYTKNKLAEYNYWESLRRLFIFD